MVEVKAFNRWSVGGIKVVDPGLVDYISLNPTFVPRTGARYAKQRFHKSKIFIIERLMNKLMIPGHKGKKHKVTSCRISGKANQVYQIIEETFRKIEHRTKTNPIEVFVRAVENAAPREEIIAIEYGGARYPKAVECAPQRRIDIALRHMAQGAFQSRFNKKKKFTEALADEIISASNLSPQSNAIARKQELERQADASR